jgi:hypothetical protein
MRKLRLTRKAQLLAVLPWQGEEVAVYATNMFVAVRRDRRGRQVFADVPQELAEAACEAAWEAEKRLPQLP